LFFTRFKLFLPNTLFSSAAGSDCAPYFECTPGFYKRFSASSVVCAQCEGATLPAGHVWATSGLSDNFAETCLSECAFRAAWPAQDCTPSPVTTYLLENLPGFYKTEAQTLACPAGFTSRRNRAIALADCIQCVLPQNGMGDPCNFVCSPGFVPRGDKCFQTVDWCKDMEGYSMQTGVCLPTALPWQARGKIKYGVIITDATHTFPAHASGISFVETPYTESVYTAGSRHRVVFQGGAHLDLQGSVCSWDTTSISQRSYLLLVFCGKRLTRRHQ
jgi:hypothetical protein